MNRFLAAVTVGVFVVVGAACTDNSNDSEPDDTTTTTAAPVAAPDAPDGDAPPRAAQVAFALDVGRAGADPAVLEEVLADLPDWVNAHEPFPTGETDLAAAVLLTQQVELRTPDATFCVVLAGAEELPALVYDGACDTDLAELELVASSDPSFEIDGVVASDDDPDDNSSNDS